MKKQMVSAARKSLVMTVVLLISISAMVLGQSKGQLAAAGEYKFSEREIKDLTAGIVSENEGLRRSAIYWSGFYQVKETAPVLVEQLKNEKDPNTKILISLVLYRLNDMNGINAVKVLAAKDDNKDVRRMAAAILKEFDNKTLTAQAEDIRR